jgi:hypothetical protein
MDEALDDDKLELEETVVILKLLRSHPPLGRRIRTGMILV